MTRGHEAEIEAILSERTGRSCVYVPSCRLGIYISLTTWLNPGDRILMSPLNDDVVLFTVLAAGLRPVMAPISPSDGNIDPDPIPDHVWASLSGVLTTNLYGLPDRMPELEERCRRLGLLLIEDAAHALHTDFAGRAVGSFGEVAVFSLSKHMAGVGGVVAVADAGRRAQIEAARDRIVRDRSPLTRFSDLARPRAVALLERLRLRAPVRAARRALGAAERREHRMPLRPELLRATLDAAPAIEPFDRWVRVDKHDYRLHQRGDLLRRTVEALSARELDREARTEGTERLRRLATAAPAARAGDPQALYRVPLLVRDREAAGAALESVGHPLHYVFDPPLDDYAGSEFVEPSQGPEPARWWARHALPVDPLLAEDALAALRRAGDAAEPASTAKPVHAPTSGRIAGA